MRFDTVIANGTVVIPRAGQLEANIAIKDSKIAGLLDPSLAVEADEVIEARGRHVFPGLIDPHQHIGFMGKPLTEITSETRSAAIGGVTTVVNYVLKPEPYDAPFQEFVDHIERLAYVDMSCHFGCFSEQHLVEMEHYVKDLGVTSTKFFMAYKGGEGKKRGVAETDDGFLFDFLTEMAKHRGAVAAIHAENIEVVWRLEPRVRAQGTEGLAAYHAARPGFAEADNVFSASYFGQITGCPVYFVHTSSRESVAELRRLRSAGKVYVETCPQYLSLTIDSPCGVLAKVNPPVRTQADVEALWAAVRDGVVDTIGTDHSSKKRESKKGDIWQAGAAFPGVGTMLAVLLDEGVHKRGISLQRIAEITSYNTARIFNLYPRKGSLQVGSDADLAIIDLNIERVVDADYLQSNADYSPWEGQRLRGWAVQTLVRGKTVMKDGEIVGQGGYGSYVRRDAPAVTASAPA